MKFESTARTGVKYLFRKTFIFLTFFLWFIMPGILFSQVVFTEIMFDLEGSDYHDEFVEIYNLSVSETVDLSGWQFSDSAKIDNLVEAGGGMLLPPNQYCVILDGSYFGNSTAYEGIIPDSALIIKIDNNAFGSNGLTNTKSKELSLIDSSGNTIDTYRYSTDNEPGYSDEKILLNQDNTPANWGNSLLKGGTPGFKNSLSPYDYDLGFPENAVTYLPSINIKTLHNVEFSCIVSNSGLQPFNDSLMIKLFVDMNSDSVYNQGDQIIIDRQIKIELAANEQIEFKGDWLPDNAGNLLITAVIFSPSDQNESNNISSIAVTVVESRETVKINEIKFLAFENEPEWIELVNSGEERLSLRDWGLADQKDTTWIDSLIFINPGQYKVFAADSGLSSFYDLEDSLVCVLKSFPTLNNTEDVIYLINPAGGWVEQTPYTEDWLEGEDWRNPSLERIHFDLSAKLERNWGPSTDPAGATPAKVNSIYAPVSYNSLKITISPNPFSPDGDGSEDHTIITIQSPAEKARARIEIFDIMGRKIRTIKDNSFSGASLAVAWNGREDSGKIVRMGIYIIYVQVLDDRSGLLEEYKETVVVAGRL
jgi:hypothetical protein